LTAGIATVVFPYSTTEFSSGDRPMCPCDLLACAVAVLAQLGRVRSALDYGEWALAFEWAEEAKQTLLDAFDARCAGIRWLLAPVSELAEAVTSEEYLVAQNLSARATTRAFQVIQRIEDANA
jgi:hypothetical protein